MGSLSNREMITAIFGDQKGWIVAGLMDQAGPRGQLNRQKDFYYPEDLDNLVEWAEQHRNEDAYISPIVYGDMRKQSNGSIRRIPENAISTHVVYQDSDYCPPEKFRLTPSIHVTTSAGKFQDYWILSEPVSSDVAATLSRKIAVAHKDDGSDPSSWSENKFLRLLTTNTRHGFPEPVTATSSGIVYDVADIEAEYGSVELTRRAVMRVPNETLYNDVDDLPNYLSAVDSLPKGFNTGLFMDQPPEGLRSEMRYRLLCDLFRADVSFENAIAIAWHAPVAVKWREDPRGLSGLIAEAYKAQSEVVFEDEFTPEPASDDEVIALPTSPASVKVRLLSDEERDLASSENTFIRRYQNWAMPKSGSRWNPPYARMNAWTLLSAAFGDFGVIPSTGDSLNFYAMGLGGSGSGKSTALHLWDKCMTEVFESDHSWMIGNASPQALHDVLIERDNKVSVLVADEAHGWFNQVNNSQWATGTYEQIALYYDGVVPPMHRTSGGRRDNSGKRATTTFIIHMMGTMKGELSLPNVLTTSMFLSGFLARFIWFIGRDIPMNEETLRQTNGDGEFSSLGYEPMARQWAAEFRNTKKILRVKTGRTRIPMNATQSALDRMTKFAIDAAAIAQKRREWEILEPCIVRMASNVRRAASLLAIEQQRETVEYQDVVCAIEAAEEWLASLFTVAEQISESAWARDTDEIENFIASKGGSVRREVVMTRFKSRHTRDLLMQIDALIGMGRLKEESRSGNKMFVVVRGK